LFGFILVAGVRPEDKNALLERRAGVESTSVAQSVSTVSHGCEYAYVPQVL